MRDLATKKRVVDEGPGVRLSYAADGLWATYFPGTGRISVVWVAAQYPVASGAEARKKAQELTKKLGWPAWKERHNAKEALSKPDGTSVELCMVTGRVSPASR